jgi:hypothetical protein
VQVATTEDLEPVVAIVIAKAEVVVASVEEVLVQVGVVPVQVVLVDPRKLN